MLFYLHRLPNERPSREDYITFVSRRREGVRLWLDHSSNLHLSVFMTIGPLDSSEDLALLLDTTEFLQIFARHHLRWKEVGLNVTRSTESQLPFGQLATKGLPLLKSVTPDTCVESSAGPTADLMRVFSRSKASYNMSIEISLSANCVCVLRLRSSSGI